MRRGLRQIIIDALGSATIREVADAESLVRAIKQSIPDLIIFDISLPGPGGLTVFKEVRQLLPQDVPIVVLSSHLESEFVLCTIAAGAHAVVLTERADEDLFRAIEAIQSGKIYVSTALLTTRSTLAVLSADRPHTKHLMA